ncbi:YmfQ family protein [Lachnospiraceae bacterium OttesenSCG-928-D06]|nr:YmfQ family protein [Lachnospiraceae bacterium OttesenSCG-928-D06]
MAKDIDLLSYWMPLLRQLKEFKEIAKTEEPELRYILEAIDRTLNNMFIETADEIGIKRFEEMIGIYPEAGDSLDTRRFNILIKWNDKVPYTEKTLYNRLVSITGSEDSFSITKRYDEYTIDIVTKLGVAGAFDAVTALLGDMLPANLVLNLKNVLEAVKTSPLSIGIATCTAMAYQITNDINREYRESGALFYGVGVANAGTHIITNDIASSVLKETALNEAIASSIAGVSTVTNDIELEEELEGSMAVGMGVGMAHTKLITQDITASANITGNHTVASPVSNAIVITLN